MHLRITYGDDHRDAPPAGCTEHHVGPARVAVSSDTPLLWSPAGPLLIIGDLFDRGQRRIDALPIGAVHAIVASRGRSLTTDYWGRYVALWQDPRDAAIWVLRDPSGAVPLHVVGHPAGRIIVNDLAALPPAARAALTIDHGGLAQRLRYPELAGRRTALAGVEDVLPGEAIRLDSNDAPVSSWSPWSFAKDPQGLDDDRLRGTVMATVAALAQAHAHAPLMLELSGGLDSSVIAACLAAAGVAWRASTIVTPRADGDETAYARLVAIACNAPLQCIHPTPDRIMLSAPPGHLTVRPSGYAMLGALDQALAAAADCDGAAIISGTGGDNVFCSLRSAVPVIDAWRGAGLCQALRTAHDMAQLTETPIPKVLASALAYGRRDRRHPLRWREDASFLSSDWPAVTPDHPWLQRPRQAPPGARAHIVSILRAHNVAATVPRARGRQMLFPLLSQPVIEACLRAPSWHWVAGGIDRALVRRAFSGRVPPAILARRGKGRLTSLLAPAYDRDRAAIARLLLDGQLAALGLIDREAVHRATRARATYDGAVYMRILELLDAELWARSVTGTASR